MWLYLCKGIDSALQGIELLTHATTRTNLENMLREISRNRTTHRRTALTENIQKG